MKTESNPKEVVLSFLDALNERDLKAARSHLDDGVTFAATDGALIRGAEGLEADRLETRDRENIRGW